MLPVNQILAYRMTQLVVHYFAVDRDILIKQMVFSPHKNKTACLKQPILLRRKMNLWPVFLVVIFSV